MRGMKLSMFAILPLTAMTACVIDVAAAPVAATTTEGVATPSLSSLNAYGDWIRIESYGRVWRPTAVTADWRPYTLGTWENGPHGWTWQSELSWGAITFHYGRWTRDRAKRWFWVPGETWSPATVVWRIGGGFIGWAPLPPESELAEQDPGILESAWVFVLASELQNGRLSVAALPATMNATVFARTSKPLPQQAALGP